MPLKSKLLASAPAIQLPDCCSQSHDLPPLPARVDRKVGAELVTRLFFPVSPRTLEAWPLTWRRVNGKALCEVVELFALAQTKLDAAPPIRGGRTKGGA